MNNYWNAKIPKYQHKDFIPATHSTHKNIDGVEYYGKSLEGKCGKKASRILKTIGVVGLSLLILPIPVLAARGTYRKVGVWTREVYHNQTLSYIHQKGKDVIKPKKPPKEKLEKSLSEKNKKLELSLLEFTKLPVREEAFIDFTRDNAASISEFMLQASPKWFEFSEKMREALPEKSPVAALLDRWDFSIASHLGLRKGYTFLMRQAGKDLQQYFANEAPAENDMDLFLRHKALFSVEEVAKWIDEKKLFGQIFRRDPKFIYSILPRLKYVEVEGCESSETLDKIINQGQAIEYIKAYAVPIFNKIVNASQIKGISLSGFFYPNPLSRFVDLKIIDINPLMFENINTVAEWIGKNKQLEQLNLKTEHRFSLTNEIAKAIAGSSHLKKIQFFRSRIDDEGIQCLKELPLEFLYIDSLVKLSGKAFEECKFKDTLTHLVVLNNSILFDDAFLKSIGNFHSLESLSIHINAEKGLESLKNLKKLRELDISESILNEEQFKDFKYFEKLNYLNISFCEVTLKGLENVLMACPSLKNIRIDDDKLPIEGLAKLKARYSEVKIYRIRDEPTSTAMNDPFYEGNYVNFNPKCLS